MMHITGWSTLADYYRKDENEVVEQLLTRRPYSTEALKTIQAYASELVIGVRKARLKEGGLDAFMLQYDLSSEEGIALMCLAESLLRIPDNETVDKLIREKIGKANWNSHLGKSHSIFVNAATWALMLTGKVISEPSEVQITGYATSLTRGLKRLASKGGEPIIRQAIFAAMRILSKQFVMGRTIKEALKRSQPEVKKGYRYSYDMLGEAAYTQNDAERYYKAYEAAIAAINELSNSNPIEGPGISIKLSALHPRFEYQQWDRLHKELIPIVKQLAYQAKAANIGFCLDAEEASTLLMLLEVMKSLIEDPHLAEWEGLGLAIQAYQKRAPYVIDELATLCRTHQRKIMVRLVKGAYWDTEIKLAQVQGFKEYPVFTRKSTTDVNYLYCAKRLFELTDVIYPQFATHNAFSVAAITDMAKSKNIQNYEFQCLHGMGKALYDQIVTADTPHPCRVYAPVGTHEDLLAYLVRRLLENGANSSFINRIADENLPVSEIVADPYLKLSQIEPKRHPQIPLPKHIYGKKRLNSKGIDWQNPSIVQDIIKDIYEAQNKTYEAIPTTHMNDRERQSFQSINPTDLKPIGKVLLTTSSELEATLARACSAYPSWSTTSVQSRSKLLKQLARLLHTHRKTLIALLALEAGKTLDDATAEVREAIDFCRYYAVLAEEQFAYPIELPGPTGEVNRLYYAGRGIIACISPWNFPLAIFIGQVTAALAAGNCVIAKPAIQTPLIAAKAIELFHEAGFSPSVVQLVLGEGATIGNDLVCDSRVKGVIFTGSTHTARRINQTLANRPGPIVPFIAETGGQNAMIVDSTALPEQVVQDLIVSAFKSAGQRCSSARVLYLQEEIADKMIEMLIGAMKELRLGNPNQLSTDIGPVIDRTAHDKLMSHVNQLSKKSTLLYEVPLNDELNKGTFFGPRLFEIKHINELEEEVFGPVLHVIRFKGKDLNQVINDINLTGFGLTMGIHTRIEETFYGVQRIAHIGNIYVNRNMTGAVVGTQPFGGEGLSGTGPKAGGPNYLMRLVTERTLTINTTATGGNAQLMLLTDM